MIVPYKPPYFTKATRKFKYIIIHDLSCRFDKMSRAEIDDKKAIVGHLRTYNWVFNDQFDLPFHFLCEKIGRDYETIMGTPFCYRIVYDDIPSQYDVSIHIGIACDCSVSAPSMRSYQQIGYRSIASIMRWFGIPISNILLHREVSTNKDSVCPGMLFDKNKLISAIRPLILMKN